MKLDLSKIHPELQRVAKRYVPTHWAINRHGLWLVRLAMKLMRASEPPAEITVEDLLIPAESERRSIALRIYKSRSRTAPTPALIWLHGGGYVIGKPEMDDMICAHYAQELSIQVVSVDYRLAPEHPFPSALHDAYAALRWLQQQSVQLGVDAQRIAVGGASAGAGLAASLSQLAHDRQEVRPAFQLLVYPMLDDRTALRRDLDDASNVTWNQANNRFGWESYLGTACGTAEPRPYAVPARRLDLSDLPPAWIGVGSLDIFRDEDLAYAERLRASGVDCELSLVPGAFHGFDVLAPEQPVVRGFVESQLAALKKHLFPLGM